MKPIISVEGLGKSYTIRHEGQTRYKSLREEIFKLPTRLLQRSSQRQEEFWALNDVSFDVMPGDRLGIIGRNGAGKSTLLKLLSRITEPTTGRITLRGRVASLLEVGTGFHPELTGRENIFLNGAILGMSRIEVRRKFDEIVDFAGVEKFLDTPVKRYSSGMYVRLAFAVAAHLEPEILIVDEVLAVGDGDFQKKCLNKMESVSANEGRTVLFVSHNMGAIQRLCDKGLFLEQGKLIEVGHIPKVVDTYRSSTQIETEGTIRPALLETGAVSLFSFTIRDERLNPCEMLVAGRKAYFDLLYKIKTPLHDARIFFHIENDSGSRLCALGNYWFEISRLMEAGEWKLSCTIDRLPFSKGNYSVFMDLISDTLDVRGIAVGGFYIDESDFFPSHAAGNPQLGTLVDHSVTITPHEILTQ